MPRKGRPLIDPTHGSVPVSLRMSTKQFDALCSQARRESVSVPELIRRALRQAEVLKTRQRP